MYVCKYCKIISMIICRPVSYNPDIFELYNISPFIIQHSPFLLSINVAETIDIIYYILIHIMYLIDK